MEKRLTKKDICLCIATYNRSDDIKKTLESLQKNKNIPGEIVIIDQSKNDKTKIVCREYKRKKFPIKYLYIDTPSADISMNIGLKYAREKYPLIATAGDDVDFLEGYFEEILKIFNKDSKIMAAGGIDTAKDTPVFGKEEGKFFKIFFKIFFLPYKKKNSFSITGPYGHTLTNDVDRVLKNVQWIPGFNCVWRSEVYKDYLWPEIIGYNVLDDIESSYHVYKKYGKGSLAITPTAKVFHRRSHVSRYGERKRIFVNHEDHFTYYYTHFYNFSGTMKLIWSLFGIILGNSIRATFGRKKEYWLNFKYNLEAIKYCYNNKHLIKQNKKRLFLNKDLSMKEKF
jgi:glycosyltransferase involved in cell wall biosynthesis